MILDKQKVNTLQARVHTDYGMRLQAMRLLTKLGTEKPYKKYHLQRKEEWN